MKNSDVCLFLCVKASLGKKKKLCLLLQVSCINANYTDGGLFGFYAITQPEDTDKVNSRSAQTKQLTNRRW